MKKIVIALSCMAAFSCASNKLQESRTPAQIGNVGTFSTSPDDWKSNLLQDVVPYSEKRGDDTLVVKNVDKALFAMEKVRAKYKADERGCDAIEKETQDLIKVVDQGGEPAAVKAVSFRYSWCEPYFEQAVGFIIFEMKETKEKIMLETSGKADQCVIYNGRPHTISGYRVYCFGAKSGSGGMKSPYVDAYVITHDENGKNLKLQSRKTVDLPYND